MIPPVPFAFGFANVPMLAWLGAASIPIILHLLNRRKFRETPWAAMRFLLAAIRKNHRRIRVEQWLLLAVRTLLILLVVSAMAKPFLESLGAIPVFAGQRTHRVLVLDGSLSMAYAPAGATRFEQAKTLAAQLVRDARPGDAISLILMADPPRVVIGAPSANHAEVLNELEDVSLPHGGTHLASTFEAVDRVLESSTIPQKEVVFLSDLQAASWRAGSGDEGLKRALEKLSSRRPRSVVIDLGAPGGENRAITDLRLARSPIVTVGDPATFRVTARNFGPDRVDGARVRLLIDGRVGPELVVDLPVGEDVAVDLSHAFAGPGDHLVEAQIDDDPLKLDNRRWLALPVRDRLNVLLVDGDPGSRPFEGETDYLAQALDPGSESPEPVSPLRTEVVTEGQLTRRDLGPSDAIVLCDIAQFSEAERDALDAYLKQGGGLVVFGGAQVLAENYNRLLHDGGDGLLPAALGPSVGGDQVRDEGGFGFDPLGYRHPIVADYAGAEAPVQAGLTDVRTWQYQKLVRPEKSSARVALAFRGPGDPAVIEGARHRGIVLQVATSANDAWTNWPLHKSYPPVMEQMVLLAASGRVAERTIRVGQPLDQAQPASGVGAPVTVVRPDGRPVASKLREAGEVSLLHVEETDLSGPYQVRIGPPVATEATFAANPDPAESDPAKLDRRGLAESLPGWTFAYFTDWQRLARDSGSISRRGELHRQLLFAVLALLMIESALAWKFGHHATRA